MRLLITKSETLGGLRPRRYVAAVTGIVVFGSAIGPAPGRQTVAVTQAMAAAAQVTYAPTGSSSFRLPNLTPGFHARRMIVLGQPFDYQIYVPVGYTPAKQWPIILEAGGTGEFGTDNQKQLHAGLGPHIAALGERAIVVFPQWRFGATLPDLRTLVHITALKNTIAEANADTTRIYMSGNSGGGFRVWEYLYKYPKLFAAGVVAAGGIDPVSTGTVPATVAALRTMPIWIFAADDDRTVPAGLYFGPIVAEWDTRGIGDPPVRHTLYHAIGGHQATWDKAFADPALWNWLFAQHR